MTTPGRFVWYDLMTTDLERSQAFYAGHGRDDQEYTPDFALNTVIDGVAACKRAGAKDLAGCVERATRLDAILPVAPR